MNIWKTGDIYITLPLLFYISDAGWSDNEFDDEVSHLYNAQVCINNLTASKWDADKI